MTIDELKAQLLDECTKHARDLNAFVKADNVPLEDYPESLRVKLKVHRQQIKRILKEYEEAVLPQPPAHS